MQKALFPGTFDPPTLGHLEVIQRASKLFDTLYVGIGENIGKGNPLLTKEQRMEVLRQELQPLSNVEIVSFSGLVSVFADKLGVNVLIRSLRNGSDLDFEMQMASANRSMNAIETLFMIADPKTSQISSTLIRELAHHKAPLREFVPGSAITIIHKEQ